MSLRWPNRARSLVVLAVFLCNLVAELTAPLITTAQPPSGPLDPLINRLFTRLTIEQRIGQLALVTFSGSSLGNDAAVVRLIRDYHIGGVLLLASRDNIDGRDHVPNNVLSLTNSLQQFNYGTSLNDNGQPSLGYVPLFIGTSHEGDSISNTQIATGTTLLPSNMALGATWNPDHARHVGNIAGEELSAMGINLMLGPSLDVQPPLSPDTLVTIGTRAFGGEPWWVGRMAQSYVMGAHEGSNGRLIVVPRDFPGLGASDRRPEQEIPVVPRTAEELSRNDLVPYFAVTGLTANPLSKADGLQCASIRYQGQNIRTVTRPSCIDEQAFGDLIHMDGFGTWRTDGGMIVSDSLGTRAIRRWYNQPKFPHRQVAREALLAGNDVLLLDDFGANVGDDDFTNIADVLDFFATLYKSDPVFKTRVDQSVRRILRQKLEAYNADFTLGNVIRNTNNLRFVGENNAELYTIARDAVTLLAPSRQRLSPPPNANNNIVIFTDMRYTRQCSYCAVQPVIPMTAVQDELIRLYGPEASGQVTPANVRSFSFLQLKTYLTTTIESTPPPPGAEVSARISVALDHADWIVFAMLDVAPDVPGSNVVQSFLELQPMLATKAHTVVMAFGAPAYLSSTDISKLAAYYGIYSSTAPFVDAAARALFQEVSYEGDAPVSLPAISYDVVKATSPDPGQIIRIVPANGEAEASSGTSIPGPLPTTAVGDTLLLRTEPILDRNGHIVPDDTPVTFTLSFVTEGVQRQQESLTRDGIARTSFTLSRPGQIHITAASGDAITSVIFQITVAENNSAALLQTIEPPQRTPLPQSTATATATPTEPPTATVTPTISASPVQVAAAATSVSPVQPPRAVATISVKVSPRDFVAAFLGLLVVALLGFALNWQLTRSIDAGLRVALSSATGGLIGYIAYALGVPGTDTLRTAFPGTGALFATLMLGVLGLLIGWRSAQ